ncbi:unnamed protein product [Hymenolepis diminuta]|uniref:Uncharacterized protein n=1 Tax=Hymenolepis diminuta TaxID=6216 RepID=A0A564Y7Z9_HYMDI|nr:unnamed protein product [Hymenolepis diminuta]
MIVRGTADSAMLGSQSHSHPPFLFLQRSFQLNRTYSCVLTRVLILVTNINSLSIHTRRDCCLSDVFLLSLRPILPSSWESVLRFVQSILA